MSHVLPVPTAGSVTQFVNKIIDLDQSKLLFVASSALPSCVAATLQCAGIQIAEYIKYFDYVNRTCIVPVTDGGGPLWIVPLGGSLKSLASCGCVRRRE